MTAALLAAGQVGTATELNVASPAASSGPPWRGLRLPHSQWPKREEEQGSFGERATPHTGVRDAPGPSSTEPRGEETRA